MTVKFPGWPLWNYHFKELDVKRIASITYRDTADAEQVLDQNTYRLSIGRNGVSGLTFKPEAKASLPALKDRPDAVVVEYEV